MSSYSLESLLLSFLEEWQYIKKRSPLTVRNYELYLRRFLRWSKVTKPAQITDTLVTHYRTYLKTLKGRETKLDKKTINYHLIALRNFLHYLSTHNVSLPVTKRIKLTKVSPAHPAVLQERIDAAARSAERAAIALKSALPDLSSAYNLATGRPGIRFYEGLDGIKEVLEDTLTAKETICTYADLEMIEKFIPDINRDYAAKRDKLGLKKKALLLDTQENRFLLEGYHTNVTDVKLIAAHAAPFKTVMQIYDGKISYFTLGTDTLVGVIITDPYIYSMHRALFEATWDSPSTSNL
jgi:hypothetical protein